MRIFQIVPCSLANGPGKRMVIWTAGCSIGCPGCFNPETHGSRAGQEIPSSEIVALWNQYQHMYGLDGVTISGGEPTDQIEGLNELCAALRPTCDSLVIFSGRNQKQIVQFPNIAFLCYCDVLIAGPYVRTKPETEYLYGSFNKELVFLTEKHSKEEFESHCTEVIYTLEGMLISGFPPEIAL